MTDENSVQDNKRLAAEEASGNHEIGIDGDGFSVADRAAHQAGDEGGDEAGERTADPVTGSASHPTGSAQATENADTELPG